MRGQCFVYPPHYESFQAHWCTLCSHSVRHSTSRFLVVVFIDGTHVPMSDIRKHTPRLTCRTARLPTLFLMRANPEDTSLSTLLAHHRAISLQGLGRRALRDDGAYNNFSFFLRRSQPMSPDLTPMQCLCHCISQQAPPSCPTPRGTGHSGEMVGGSEWRRWWLRLYASALFKLRCVFRNPTTCKGINCYGISHQSV